MGRQPKEKALPDEEIEEIIRKLADRLAAARKMRGLSQAALGAMAEMTQQQVFGLEQGTANVTIRTLARIARVLDVDLKTLFTKVGPTTAHGPLVESIEQVASLLEERSVQEQTFRALLEERGAQEQAFRDQILEIIGKTKADAIRKPTSHDNPTAIPPKPP